jgi:tetratricopeptide (TPR) repeat protein
MSNLSHIPSDLHIRRELLVKEHLFYFLFDRVAMEPVATREYFSVSTAISKDEFLATYKDIARVSQLLLAPLGITYYPPVTQLLNDESASQEFTKLFRSWEEVVSRAVYARQGISDDRVAASMHLFLEVEKDKDVLNAIQEETDVIPRILSSPAVVELPPPLRVTTDFAIEHAEVKIPNEPWHYGLIEKAVDGSPQRNKDGTSAVALTHVLELTTPGVAASLLSRVLDALELVIPIPTIHTSTSKEENSIPSIWAKKYGKDDALNQYPELCIPRRTFQPTDVLLLKGKRKKTETNDNDNDYDYDASGMPLAATEALLEALIIKLPTSPPQEVKISLLQYYALLDLYGSSEEVENVLSTRIYTSDSTSVSMLRTQSELPLIDLVRVGAIGVRNGISLSAVARPLSAMVVQLSVGNIDVDGKAIRAIISLTNSQNKAYRQRLGKEKGGVFGAIKTLGNALEKIQTRLRPALDGVDPENDNDNESINSDNDNNDNRRDDEDDDDDENEQEEESGVPSNWLSIFNDLSLCNEGEVSNISNENDNNNDNDNDNDKSRCPIPTELHCSVLCDVVKCLLQAFSLQQEANRYGMPSEYDDPLKSPFLIRAVKICDFAIEIDPYCVDAYEQRSILLGNLGECELMDLEEEQQAMKQFTLQKQTINDDDNDDDAVDTEGVSSTLRAAARDSLAAFLLGGSTDLTLAGTAEEAARQASRVAAQSEFRKKQLQADSLPATLPKAWLVRAYLAGYLPVSLACQVISFTSEIELTDISYLSLILQFPIPVAKNINVDVYVDDTNDIDDGENEDEDKNYLNVLPLPPQELLDIVKDDSDTGEGENENKVVYGRCKDRQAYRLLRQLCGLVEDSFNEIEKNEIPISSHTNPNHSTTHGSQWAPKDSFLANMFRRKEAQWAAKNLPPVKELSLREVDKDEFLQQLGLSISSTEYEIFQGQCTILEPPNVMPTAAASPSNMEYGKEAPSCKSFEKFSLLLRNPLVASLTGVQFSSSGRVETVEILKDTDDDDNDDEDWEDVSDGGNDTESLNSEEEDNDEEKEKKITETTFTSRVVSLKIRSRLLNLCAVAAYLSGDAEGSLRCLRAALLAQPLPPTGLHCDIIETTALSSVDVAVKLGALLCDMDKRDEANKILIQGLQVAETILTQDTYTINHALGAIGSSCVLLHMAELKIHELDYQEALACLGRSNRLATRAMNTCKYDNDNKIISYLPQAMKCLHILIPNILSLQGVTLFRRSPTEPDSALRLLKDACSEYENATYLLLCYGEVLSQAGDLVGALACFEAAHSQDMLNPLPFVNAGRTYQQLQQPKVSELHLNQALAVDPTFALTQIDVAQSALHKGQTQLALNVLDHALYLSRHVSDICDVLTAKTVATLQDLLEKQGLYSPPPTPQSTL